MLKLKKGAIELYENKTNLLTSQNNASLEFTGNWFIDAGILGFVNLMEEVYGWDLNELRDRIKKESEIVYYGYFPFAYFYNLSQKNNEKLKIEATDFIEQNNNLHKDILEEVWWKYIVELFREKWVKKKLEVKHESKGYSKRKNSTFHYTYIKYRELIKEREEAINDLISNENFKRDIQKILKKQKVTKDNFSIEDFEILERKLDTLSEDKRFLEKANRVVEENRELKRYLNKIWDEVKMKNISKGNDVFYRIPVDSSFFKNYLFFNNSRGIFEQLEDLRNLLEGNTKYSEYLSKIDRVISKFLPSDKKFANISYTEFQTKILVRNVPYLFVYLINFLNAFTFVKNIGSVFFYSSDLEFTYRVNKRIKAYLNENSKDNDLTILKITLQSVIDTVLEVESIWALENMYLIRYEKLSQQDIIGVEYLGISKLQASIILDDTLRNALNKKIPVVAFKKLNGKIIIEKWSWVLEEFIKNNSLLPIFYRSLWLYLNNTINKFSIKSFIYSSSIDKNITNLKEKNKKWLFSKEFFYKYKNVINNIKEFAERMFSISYKISLTFASFSKDKRIDLASTLFIRLRKGHKYAFVNILLKELIHVENKESVEDIVRFLFQEVLNNDKTWQNSAVAIISGLIYRGGENEQTNNEL